MNKKKYIVILCVLALIVSTVSISYASFRKVISKKSSIVTTELSTIFLNDTDFYDKVKSIDSSVDDELINKSSIVRETNIEIVDELDLTDDNIVSTTDSKVPIYLWVNDSKDTIYYYTIANIVDLNSPLANYTRVNNMTVPTGKSYVATDFEYSSDMEITTEFYTGTVEGSSYYIGARTGGAGSEASFAISGSESNSKFEIWYLGNKVPTVNINRESNKWYVFTSTVSDGNLTAIIYEKDNPSNSDTIVIPGGSSALTHKLYFYGISPTCVADNGVIIKKVTITQDGELTHNFVPVKNSTTNEYGMYDLITNESYMFD